MEWNECAYFESDFPFVIKNKINNWKIMSYTEEDWCKELGDKVLGFREGPKIFKESPLWESQCNSRNMSLKEFFEFSSKKQETWLYFDYHYMKDVFKENTKFLDEIKWTDLKVNLSGKDSTLWIGNEGAHTPCHMDTYGCNFVAQVFGRKRWILVEPRESENLKPTRVPYEESSIYSSFSFYTPTNDLLNLKCYSVILSPGDILFVPRHWWHYVENLDTSISINVWIPLEIDHESRLDEALVRHYISNICSDLTDEECQMLLNPNELSLTSEACSLDLIEKCRENYQKFKMHQEHGQCDVKSFFCDDVVPVEQLNINSYLKEKSETFNYNLNIKSKGTITNTNSRLCLAKSLINSYCHPKNVAVVRDSLCFSM